MVSVIHQSMLEQSASYISNVHQPSVCRFCLFFLQQVKPNSVVFLAWLCLHQPHWFRVMEAVRELCLHHPIKLGWLNLLVILKQGFVRVSTQARQSCNNCLPCLSSHSKLTI